MITLRELDDLCYSIGVYFKSSESDKEWTKYDWRNHQLEYGYRYVDDIQLHEGINGICVYLGRSSIRDYE